VATSKREFALHLVRDALSECGVSSDDIQHITEALDDEQAADLEASGDDAHRRTKGTQMRAWLGVDPGKRMRYSWQLGQGGEGDYGTDRKRR